MGIRDTRLSFGVYRKGSYNKITDVQGVKVGHLTVDSGDIQTGITAILPCDDSPFTHKLPAACHVINGFGKSTGLMQISEMGSLESPILLTNTFCVPAVSQGLIKYMLKDHSSIGDSLPTVNTVVCECNDGYLNDIRKMVLKPSDVLKAIGNAGFDFREGAVGAGRGMRCYGLKGGIGSASRIIDIGEKTYTVGALVLCNFGSPSDLMILGRHPDIDPEAVTDSGSCVVILATDLPLTSRQLGRCARRAQNGIARTGSYTGSGSGDIVIMFSTQNRIPQSYGDSLLSARYLPDTSLDPVFEMVTDCVEESIVSCLMHAVNVTGRAGRTLQCLREADPYYMLYSVR